jgi:hypothetical protein
VLTGLHSGDFGADVTQIGLQVFQPPGWIGWRQGSQVEDYEPIVVGEPVKPGGRLEARRAAAARL